MTEEIRNVETKEDAVKALRNLTSRTTQSQPQETYSYQNHDFDNTESVQLHSNARAPGAFRDLISVWNYNGKKSQCQPDGTLIA